MSIVQVFIPGADPGCYSFARSIRYIEVYWVASWSLFRYALNADCSDCIPDPES